jgi:hypothetical protein
MAFRVECECGRRVELPPGWAGEALPCACGRRVSVPAMTPRELTRAVWDVLTPRRPRPGRRGWALRLLVAAVLLAGLAALVVLLAGPL